MNFNQFKSAHGLPKTINDNDEVKIGRGYYTHTVKCDGSEVEVVTLSKDFSLWLSSLDPETREKCVSGFVSETSIAAEVGMCFHIQYGDRHLIMTLSLGREMLHVSQR